MAMGQASHVPLKVNMSGVIPAIFASSIVLFPASISSWFGQSEGMEWLQEVSLALSPGQPLYVVVFSILIAYFCFFLHLRYSFQQKIFQIILKDLEDSYLE